MSEQGPTPSSSSVPPLIQRALTALSGTSVADLHSLAQALRVREPQTPKDMRAALREHLPTLPPFAIRGVVAFLSLMSARRWPGDSEQLHNFLVSLLEATGVEANPEFLEALSSVVASRPLNVYGRGVSLQFEADRIYRSSRIVSDLRPIFSEAPDRVDDSDLPLEMLAGTVIHTLRIEYTSGEEEPETHSYSLDIADLRILQNTVSRAIAKHELMSSKFVRDGLPLIEPWSDDEGVTNVAD